MTAKRCAHAGRRIEGVALAHRGAEAMVRVLLVCRRCGIRGEAFLRASQVPAGRITWEARPKGTMLSHWGRRCPDYDADCPACRAWALFDKTGKVPTVMEVTP